MDNFKINKSKFNLDEIHNSNKNETQESQRKFTLKLNKVDLLFLKKISEFENLSVNQIIDYFIFNEIKKFLQSINKDEAVILINAADLLNQNNNSQSLFYDVFSRNLEEDKYHSLDVTVPWESRTDIFQHLVKVLNEKKLFNYDINGYNNNKGDFYE